MKQIFTTALLFTLLTISSGLCAFAQDTLAPAPLWKLNCDGNVYGATVTDKPDSPGERSNLNEIIFDSANSFNYDFQYAEFNPGDAITTTWELRIIDNMKDARAVITFSDVAGNDSTLKIEFSPPKIEVTPGYIDFGKTDPGESAYSAILVKNLSSNSDFVVDHLSFKSGKTDFKFVTPSLPYPIAPGDTHSFNIEFLTDKEGIYVDSVIVGDTCIRFNTTGLKAEVGSSVINVSDIDFGNIALGASDTMTFTIANEGDSQLSISDISGPALSVYELIDFRLPTPGDPIIIPAGLDIQVKVRFSPDTEGQFDDEIVFTSNAKGADSTAYLKGRGINPELNVDGIYFGRININDFPINEQYIKIFNPDETKVTIESIEIVSNIKSTDVFLIDKTSVVGISIGPKSTLAVPVEFVPDAIGYYEIKFQIKDSKNINPVGIVAGTAIESKIDYSDHLFDPTILNDFSNPAKSQVPVRFLNTLHYDIDRPDTLLSDNIIFTDYIIGPSNDAISDDGTNWGSEGFRFDKNAIELTNGSTTNLPKQVQPGEYIEIDADFVSIKKGWHKANFTVADSRGNEYKSEWSGFWQASGFYSIPETDNASCCVDETASIACIMGNKNGSGGVLEVSSLEFSPAIPQLSLSDNSLMNGFSISDGDSINFDIVFQPDAIIAENVTLIINNDPENELNINFSVRSFDHKAMSSNTLLSYPDNMIKPEEQITYMIDLKTEAEFDLAGITEFDIYLQYENDFIEIPDTNWDNINISNPIIPGDLIKDKFNMKDVETISDTDGLKTVRFNFVSRDGSILKGNGNLFGVKFYGLLPSWLPDENSTPADSIAKIKSMVIPRVLVECAEIAPDSLEIGMDGVCGYGIRQIVISANDYDAGEITPSVTSGAEINFNYSLGLSSDSNIEIYDLQGRTVRSIYIKKQKYGSHTEIINIENINNGMYFLRFTSGPFSATKSFIINR